MNPIALRHGRRVYAYACGRCHQLADYSAWCDLYKEERRAKDIQRVAEYSKSQAAKCCTCHRCRAPLPEGQRGGDCPTCAEKERTLREETERNRLDMERMLIEACGGVVEPALRLRQAMIDRSEDRYGREWVGDLEYDLWTAALVREEDEPRRLRALATEARGWWRENDGEPAFIALEDWERLYAKWITARVSLTPPGAGVG